MVTTKPRGSARLHALDVARALAIFGMIVVNVGPYTTEGPASLIIRALNGRASILFVVLAGIGVTFLARRPFTKRVSRRSTLLWRGLLLMLIGLALQVFDHGVNVILPTYAALFILAAFVVRLSMRWLFWAAVASTFLGPVIWILVRQLTNFQIDPARFGDTPLELVTAVVISGPYPLVVWIAPFMLGVWVGRQPLGNPTVQRRLIIGGAVASLGAFILSRILLAIFGHPDQGVVEWDRLFSSFGHSQMPLWVISASGTAALTIGVLLRLVPSAGRAIRPLIAVGQIPLTAYAAHLIIIALLVHPGPETPAMGLLVSTVMMVAIVAYSTVWVANFRYGPLEALLRMPPSFLKVSYQPPQRHRRRQYIRPYPRHPKRA
ncbi:DUF418 domain-containing protein [Garicola koreensis]|uniref:Putative membrane protein YeiB n=1 Tax=Garicola koreensis TaxID=1262554 RepID=A0A7W5XZ13_9MICC|nr:DUF418 domain-containing protein [Garicola koreensis]MBB3667056.1 putative membrane protein YeiB [Garicola koreensis]